MEFTSPSDSSALPIVSKLHENITLDVFMKDYYVGGAYLPIKLLEPEDSQKFIECLFTYDQEVIDDVYKHRAIKLQLFIEIMEQIELSINYKIWKFKCNYVNVIDANYGCFNFYSNKMSCWDCCCCGRAIELVIDPNTYKMRKLNYHMHTFSNERLHQCMSSISNELDLDKYIT